MKLSRSFPFLLMAVLVLLAPSCGEADPTPPPTLEPTDLPQESPTQAVSTPVSRDLFDFSTTGFGFFPTPPEPTVSSSTQNIKAMSEHADIMLFQEAIPWETFQQGVEVDSPRIRGIGDVVNYGQFYGMQPVIVVDPLNGLNRREFQGLPEAWGQADFSTPEVRTAYKNFSVRIAREFQPRYLGLASEINTYLDTYPDQMDAFLSLYQETYRAVKEESPDTQVFVTFQWDDLNRLDGDGTPYDVKWDQIEIFEPELDIWAISTYPHFFHESLEDVPVDYYTPLLERTEKPLAIAESGWTTQETGRGTGTPEEQAAFLEEVDDQIGERLAFWVNLIYADLDWEAYRTIFAEQGSVEDMETLSHFVYLGMVTTDGTPKPALQIWDKLRARD